MAENPPIGLPRVVFVDVLDLPPGRKPTAGDVKRALNVLQSRLVKEAEQGAARAKRRAEAQIKRQEAARQASKQPQGPPSAEVEPENPDPDPEP